MRQVVGMDACGRCREPAPVSAIFLKSPRNVRKNERANRQSVRMSLLELLRQVLDLLLQGELLTTEPSNLPRARHRHTATSTHTGVCSHSTFMLFPFFVLPFVRRSLPFCLPETISAKSDTQQHMHRHKHRDTQAQRQRGRDRGRGRGRGKGRERYIDAAMKCAQA
eukprot:2589091-Pleurochrysis_carterae.AAC.2